MNIRKYSGLIVIGVIIIVLLIFLPFLFEQKEGMAKYVYLYPDKSSRTYFVYPDTTFNFILQFKIHVVGRGNVHTFDCSRWEADHSEWIYLKRKIGKLEASQIMLTHAYGRQEIPYAFRDIKGDIELTKDSVCINIEIPISEDNKVIQKWIPYHWNGKYPLKEGSTVPLPDTWIF